MIEDACHALGAEYGGRRVGSIADMTVFSFHPVKHITTGEGGMVTTNDAKFAETLRRFRNHGISSDARAAAECGAVALRDGAAGIQLPAARYCLCAGDSAAEEAGRESGAAAGNCGALYGGVPRNPGRDSACGAGRGESGMAPVSDSTGSGEADGGSRARFSAHCVRRTSA